MLHLCECQHLHMQYWDFFFNLIYHMGFELPEHKPVFLATRYRQGALNDQEWGGSHGDLVTNV